MSKSKFDELFDEAFQSAVEKLPDLELDSSKAWDRVQPKIEAARRKSRARKRTARLLILAASIAIGTFFLGQAQIVKAFNPLYQSITKMTENLVSYIFGNDDRSTDGAKTAPPPSGQMNDTNNFETGNLVPVAIEFQAAKERVSFPLPTFTVPDRFALERTEIFIPAEDSTSLSNEIRYTFIDTENKIFRLTIKKLDDSSNLGSGVNPSGTSMSTVQIKNGTGYLTTSTDGSEKIEFLAGNLYVLILGELTNEEILGIARTISF